MDLGVVQTFAACVLIFALVGTVFGAATGAMRVRQLDAEADVLRAKTTLEEARLALLKYDRETQMVTVADGTAQRVVFPSPFDPQREDCTAMFDCWDPKTQETHAVQCTKKAPHPDERHEAVNPHGKVVTWVSAS